MGTQGQADAVAYVKRYRKRKQNDAADAEAATHSPLSAWMHSPSSLDGPKLQTSQHFVRFRAVHLLPDFIQKTPKLKPGNSPRNGEFS